MQRTVSGNRRLHLAALLLVLAGTAWLARHESRPPEPRSPEPRSPEPPVVAQVGNWYYPLRKAALDVVLHRPVEVPAPAAEQQESPLEQEPRQESGAPAPRPGVWPEGYHKERRPDQAFTVWGHALYLSKHDLLALWPDAESKENPFRHDRLDGIEGDVRGDRLSGTYDTNGVVRALSGRGLESSGTPIVDLGDTASKVVRRLGLPTSANYEYIARNGETCWTYEYDTVTVHIHFREGVVSSVCLYDRTFQFGHIRC